MNLTRGTHTSLAFRRLLTAFVMAPLLCSHAVAAAEGTRWTSFESPSSSGARNAWNSRSATPREDERSDAIHVLDQADRALLEDVATNPVYREETRTLLQEQIRDGFIAFARDNREPLAAFPGFDDEPLDATLDMRVQDSPVEIQSVMVRDLYSDQLETAQCLGQSSCPLLNSYDTSTAYVWVRWRVKGANALANLESYLSGVGDRYMTVLVNDSPKNRAQNYQGPGDYHVYTTAIGCGTNGADPCLTTVFHRDGWYPHQPPWPTWQVTLEFWDTLSLEMPFIAGLDEWGNPILQSSVDERVGTAHGVIEPPPTLQSFWTHSVGQSVISDRCTSCHDMDTVQDILDRHKGAGLSGLVEPKLSPSSVHPQTESVYHCDNCHEQQLPYLQPGSGFDESRWATPTQAQDINWGEIVNAYPHTWASEICNRMIANLPTAEAREHHFHEDARLFWAVAKGELPVLAGTLPTAAPHDYTKFLRRFDLWNSGGTPCP